MGACLDKARIDTGSIQEPADFPVTFAGTVGLYRAARRELVNSGKMPSVAVLFVSSWGFEELCARKFWRLLASRLAGYGIASMRFDYPGTGDALDPDDAQDGLESWISSVHAAAERLKQLSGAEKLVLIGHGIGAAFAWKAAETRADIAGIALAAPALSGRGWLREFVALSRIANQGAIQHAASVTGPTMGEQLIPEPIIAGIRAINITAPSTVPAPEVFLLKQQTRPADDLFAQHMSGLEVNFRADIFEGYIDFVRDVLFSVPPQGAIDALAGWADTIASRYPHLPSASVLDTAAGMVDVAPLAGDSFSERPVRFGEENRLYGILCEPVTPRRGATVLVLPTGYERMSGWGRITAHLCRDLAREGIASLRLDVANVADSPAAVGAPAQIIYNDCQLRDVDAALAFLDAEKLFPVVATGRCSGGWTVYKSAVRNPRLSGVVPVNVFDFYVPPDADVEALLISSRQPLASYGAKLMSGGFWKRLLKGEVRIMNGVVNMWAMIVAKAISCVTPVMVRFPFLHKRFDALSKDFRQIAANGTKMTIVYTEGDVGGAMLETNFGRGGRLLSRRYGRPTIVFIEGADHNLTTADARKAWTNEVAKMALQFSPERG